MGEIGGGCAKGEKFLSKPDVFPMYKACKDSKDQGGFHDFVEILKLYDKNADDTILEFELVKLLVNLGEKLTKEEAKNLMKELATPLTMTASSPSSLSWRRCALLRSKRFTLSLSSEYKKPPIFHHSGSGKQSVAQIFGATDEPSRPKIMPRRNSSLFNIPRPRSLDRSAI